MISDSFQISYSGGRGVTRSRGTLCQRAENSPGLRITGVGGRNLAGPRAASGWQGKQESQCSYQGSDRASLQPCSDLQILNISYFTSIFLITSITPQSISLSLSHTQRQMNSGRFSFSFVTDSPKPHAQSLVNSEGTSDYSLHEGLS